MDIYYQWDNNKNDKLIKLRGICFEQIVMSIQQGYLVDIIENPNFIKYPNQKMLVVNINNYIWLIPFTQEQENVILLKTIVPSRKATKKYLGGAK